MFLKLTAGSALAVLFALAGPVHAQSTVTPLTGGDSGEGFAPLSTVYASLAAYYGNGTVQGVVFDTNFNALSFGSTSLHKTTGGSGAYFPIVTANDTALDAILSHGAFTYQKFGDGPINLTVSGLTIGTTYQIDSLISNISGDGNGGRTEDVTATGLTVLTGSQYMKTGTTANPGGAYDYRQTLLPDLSGKISMSYSSPGSGFPLLSGFVVSFGAPPASAAPEPSQVGMLALTVLGLGGLALKAHKRKSVSARLGAAA